MTQLPFRIFYIFHAMLPTKVCIIVCANIDKEKDNGNKLVYENRISIEIL